MMPIWFTALLLGVLALRESIVYAHQAADTGKLGNVEWLVASDQEAHAKTNTAGPTTSAWLRGRKLGVQNVGKGEVMKVKETTNSVAYPSVEKCGHPRKGKLSTKCQLKARRVPSRANLDDFMPLSSDYRMARTHPPKNN